jgi:sugar phosphate isomerase/epimerase
MCTTREHDLGTVGTKVADRISMFRETLDFASQFGVRDVVSVPVRGPLESGVTEQDEIDQYVAALAIAGEHAASLGMRVVIEPLVRYETHLINRLEQAVEIAKSVDSPGVGIMADFFHMNVEEADIAASISVAGRWIHHVHLADSNRLNPGRGHTDFKPALQTLKSVGFAGSMALECRLAEGPPLAELSHSSAYLSSLMS